MSYYVYNVAGRTGNSLWWSSRTHGPVFRVSEVCWKCNSLIYPADQPRSEGLDGTGGGGIGGARGSKINGGSFTTTSSRGGCGMVQIRYLKPS